MKPEIVQGQNEYNRENQLCQERFCVNVIVLVYTNDWTVQDIMFTDQSVTPIAFHKGRLKATSYLPLYRKFPTELSLLVSACHSH